jgi:hypothetical protein
MAAGSRDAEVCAMQEKPQESHGNELPPCVSEFVRTVAGKIRYRRKVREDVQAELTAHFEDELWDVTDPTEREKRAKQLIEGFGDVELLAVLCRRAKKRCRPAWAKTLIRSLQAAAVFVVLLDLYVLWFISGRPDVTVDYLARLNLVSQPQIAEADNAWPHYERAMTLFVSDDRLMSVPAYDHPEYPEHRNPAALTQDACEAIAQWIAANRTAWEEFVLAGSKPYFAESYRCSGEGDSRWLMNVRLSELSTLQHLSKLAIWSSRMHAEQGRFGQALETCLVLARAGRHWQQAGLIVEQLVGTGLSRKAHEEILAIVSRQKLSSAELAELQKRLAAVYLGPYPMLNIEEERLLFLDTVQRLFTEGGPGGGHMSPSRARDIGVHIDDQGRTLSRAAAFLHAGRDETVAKACEILNLQDEIVKMSPYERRAAGMREDVALASLDERRYAVVRMLIAGMDRPADLAFRVRALHEATLAIVALQRHRQERGAYPGALDQLKQGGFLDTLPTDPYSNGLLVYRAAGDNFVLYSLGPDFDDDGGISGVDSEGRIRMWADSGDTVFWPVP